MIPVYIQSEKVLSLWPKLAYDHMADDDQSRQLFAFIPESQ
jgi:hypothetical protein